MSAGGFEPALPAVARLRALARAGGTAASGAGPAPEERCDLCRTTVPDDHRHLLHLGERRIVCACEACWALRSGDPEYRPTGMRTLWLQDFRCDEATWASLSIPIGLAFFMRSTILPGSDGAPAVGRGEAAGVVAFYPSPAGATESELPLDAWDALVRANPVLEQLDVDGEALVVNRLADPPQYAILPIDQCYGLVGLIRTRWEGISGGDALTEAVPAFFDGIRARAVVPG
jgi:hypothetical protein